MSLTDKVRETLAAQRAEGYANDPIAAAERLADQYADIKPTPYIVPIERFVGMAVEFDLERPIPHAL